MRSEVAFVDTTILVEATLKDHTRRVRARNALASYMRSILPRYAIKEFRAGPLDTYIWFHNLLLRMRTLADAVLRAAQESAYRQHRLRTSFELQGRLLKDCYPKGESAEESADRMRRFLRRLIHEAWQARLTVTTERTEALPCFPETAPRSDEGMMILDPPAGCKADHSCELARALRLRKAELLIVAHTVSRAETRPENVRRAKSLERLIEQGADFGDRECRGLGDAVFALLAPSECVVLTTNIRDHRPLAEVLGKRAETLPDYGATS